MGLFFPMEGEKYEDDRRRKGFARYRQVLERDWKEMMLIDFAVLGTLLPIIFGVSLAVINRSILVLLLAGVIGGAIASVGIAAMYDFVLRRLRDDLIWCMASFMKSLRQNWRAALLPGVLEGLFLSFFVYAGVSMVRSGELGLVRGALIALAAFLFTLFFRLWWVQVVLFDQRTLPRLKNCLLFLLQHPKKSMLSALAEVLWWGAAIALFPYSGFLVPFLGVWYILLVGVLIVYDDLNAAFRVEEQISARFPGVLEERETPEKED